MASTNKSSNDTSEFKALYQYVKKEVLGYDDNQSLSRNQVLRLKGLSTGKFIENKKQENVSNYSYNVILATFKFCKSSIDYAIKTKQFNDEIHKFNYILTIVESEINTVYLRMKNANKQKEEANKLNNKHIEGYVNNFKNKKSATNNNYKKYNDLW